MRYLYLEKKDLTAFVEHLEKSHKVVVPVKKENLFVFEEFTDAGKMSIDYIPTILPFKKYFSPPHERLGGFKLGEARMTDLSIEIEPMVIFGAHTCDIDGLECLDHAFHKEPADPYYKKRKKSIVVIGYECMFPCDERATCVTMDTHVPKAGYDAMITDAGDKYIIHINSGAADDLINGDPIFKNADSGKAKGELQKLRAEKIKKFTVRLKADFKELPEIFKASYDSPVWEDVGKRCVSCGNCTAVCPTCYCFDVSDDVELDMKAGARTRVWDSCQFDEFAAVAGGENFREERSGRQRHRYYRKFEYPIRKYNKFFCTGCGRCTRTCMAGISLVETINDLAKEWKHE